jgi:hypothetical protein
MKTILFDLKGCPGTTPAPISVPEIQCVAVDEIKAAEAKPGGRTVLVTPYSEENGICSGQYGQWQVLTGFGGQIHRGMYCGKSFEKEYGYSSPGVSSTVDCSDTVNKGTKCLAIRDRGRWFVYCPGAGGGGAALYYGTIMGGNSTTVRTPQAEPVGTSVMALPTPFFTAEGELAPIVLPTVVNWEDYPDLMEDYLFYGAPLPVLPDGLCYVRLERPYTLLGKSWDINYPPTVEQQNAAPPTPELVRVRPEALTDITVYCDTGLSTETKSKFTLTDTTDEVEISILTATIEDEHKVVLTVEDDLDMTHVYTLFLEEGAVKADNTGTPEHNGKPNEAIVLPVVFQALSLSLVIAVNRVGMQTMFAGDLVVMQSTGLTLTDEQGVSKEIAEVLSIATSMRTPHTHVISDFGADGGIGGVP